MKLNASYDKIIENFKKDCKVLIKHEKRIFGIKIVKLNSIKYFYFSEPLQEKQLEAKERTIFKKLQGKRDKINSCQEQKAS
jgi:transposase